ncbi:MAG: hypothetical protein PVI62_17975 [Desulfobacterales bacterium]|jgi:hypothetical protein
MLRNTAFGNTSKQVVNDLEEHLYNNTQQIWESSWVRFPQDRLSEYARGVFEEDLMADKTNPNGPRRQNSCRFSFRNRGQDFLKIPVSYLLKLALAYFFRSCHRYPDPIYMERYNQSIHGKNGAVVIILDHFCIS